MGLVWLSFVLMVCVLFCFFSDVVMCMKLLLLCVKIVVIVLFFFRNWLGIE